MRLHRPKWVCLVTFALGLVIIAGCGKPKLTEIPVGKGVLESTADVSAAQAQEMAAQLAAAGFFAEKPGTVKLQVLENRVCLSYCRPEVPERFTSVRGCRELGETLAKKCFPNEPVDLFVLNDRKTSLMTVPYEPIRPDLPITISARRSFGGSSLVLKLQNKSDKHLAVEVTVENPTLKSKQSIGLELPPNRLVEHGWAEGWSYHSGDNVTVRHKDFETLSLTLN